MINKIMIKLWKTVSLIKGNADADVFCQMLIFKFKVAVQILKYNISYNWSYKSFF